MRTSNRKNKKSRTIRSFYKNTISIPDYELVGVLEGKVTYTEVFDALTNESLGVPNMEVVKTTMRPTKDPACSEEGEYYIADYK